jgi:iron-sulfur cluster assembly accessory protein
MLNITDDAKVHLQGITESQGKIPKLGISGGGCAGFSYDWQLVDDGSQLDDDEIIEWEGGKLFIDGMSLMYLFGSTIGLKKDIFGTVLEITSPAAASACGCGESVNFDMDYIDQHWDESER